MSFLLSEEHGLLRETAAQFFQETMPVSHLRELRDAEKGEGEAFDRTLWKKMAEMGFAGMMIPESYGGTDFGPLGLGLVFEEAGRNLSPSPLFATSCVAASLLVKAGSEAQKRAHLPKIAAGERLFAPAFDEGARHAPYLVACEARKVKGGFKLHGRKRFAPDGGAAHWLIVSARAGGGRDGKHGITLFLLPADAEGVERVSLSMADSRGMADILLDGVAVGADSVLGEMDRGGEVLSPILDGARIALSAEMLGGARAVFDAVLAHLKERKQFGVPIGSFQALKHRAAEIFCQIELAHSVVRDALSAWEGGREDLDRMASLAKARMSDSLRHITNEGVQLHGGMGMTDELDMGLYLKRARVQAQLYGDGGFHRSRYARLCGF